MKGKMLIVLIIVLLLAYILIFYSTLHLKSHITELDNQIENLRRENRELEQTYLTLTRPERIEAIAKKKLHLVEAKEFYVVELKYK